MVTRSPRKQRKRKYQAPHHLRRKFLSAPLSNELRQRYGRRSLPVRKGDRVKILRGDFKNLEGEVTRVSSKKEAIYVEGATMTKVDGTQVQRPIHPSNVMLTRLVEDKWRTKILERGGSSG